MSGSESLRATIATQPRCAWTAFSDLPWITVTNSQGDGPGEVNFYVSDNWDAPRWGVVVVRWTTGTGGQQFLSVTQAGCSYAVSTSAISMGAAGGNGQFDVTSATSDPNSCGSCMWTAQSDVPWITIMTTMPQAGDKSVSFSVQPNPGSARTGTITVRDKVVRITQSGQ
jgi:hypothetical protein